MKSEQKSGIILKGSDSYKRFCCDAKKTGILLLVGIAYLIWYRTTKIGIPCVFHLITHLECPGCGMTHAFASLSQFKFAEAYHYNKLSVTIVPVLAAVLLLREYRYIKTGERVSANRIIKGAEAILLTILLFITVVYGITRNVDVLREWYLHLKSINY